MVMHVLPHWRRFVLYVTKPKVALLIIEACILVALMSVIVGERGIIASQRHIMPAGDVFNFQSIARNIRHFDYPIREKRLPGFPLALLAGMSLGFDPTRVGIFISIASSAGTTLLLYALGRHFRFPVFPLAAILLLTSVAPLLTINGVRPLSDSYFMFLIVLSVYLTNVARPTKRWAIAVGLALTLMSFTRYEGVPTALLLLLLLRFRMPWRLVLLACVPLLVAGLLWLPVAKKVHGSIREFGYFRDAQEIADIKTTPAEYLRVIKAAGFGRAWQIQEVWSEDKGARQDAQQLIYSPVWWLSLLANVGVVWLVVVVRKKALPLLVAFAFYPILPAWWFLYSRYVAPMTAFYFFAAAAGAVGCWTIVRLLLHRWSLARPFVAVLLGALLVKLVLEVSPGLYAEAQARGWENNGNGYALYQALQSLRNRPEHVAVSFDYLMAYMMLGTVPADGNPLNAGRGIYLSAKPNATPAELFEYLKSKEAQILIDNGEKEYQELISYLRARDAIERTETFQWTRQDKGVEKSHLHYLRLPR